MVEFDTLDTINKIIISRNIHGEMRAYLHCAGYGRDH